jgi:hypothetical protein
MNAPIEEDPRFERLPKWVKDHLRARGERIIRLEQELAATRALLNDDVPEDAPVVIDPHSKNRRRLAVDQWTPIEFRYKPERHPDWWSYFHVTLREDNRLTVHGSDGLMIKPQSGNSAEIIVEDR